VAGALAGGRDAWVVDGFAPLPGDVVLLPGDARATVRTVYLCAESGGRELVRWSWIVLDDGRLLEIAPRGCTLYDPPTILPHGSGRFLELAAQDGALVRFEERVRAGDWEARPVRLTLGGRRWRITSTGTVTAQRLGPVPAGGWGQLRTGQFGSPDNTPSAGWALPSAPSLLTHASNEQPAEELDVYFTLAGRSGAQGEPELLGLGIWMSDIGLAFGRRLGDTPSAAGIRLEGASGERPS
jgi:hypothetical protein